MIKEQFLDKRIIIISLMIVIFSTLSIKAQVTIGSSVPPEKAALLEIKDQVAETAGGVTASKGGAILPRVELVNVKELLPFFPVVEVGETDYEDNQKPAHTGMMVYHIGNANIAAGVYVWSGVEWEVFGTKAVVKPKITALQCNNASINPSVLKSLTAYEGVLKIPYTGGNGGDYSGGTIITSTQNAGLTAILQAGTLAYGNGELIYTLSGIPANDLPAIFNIQFLDANPCQAVVSGVVLGIGQTITFYGAVPYESSLGNTISTYYPVADLPAIDGIRMDIAWSGGSGLSGIARIYNDSDAPISVTFSGVGGSKSVTINPGGFENVNPNLSWTGTPIATIVSVQVKVSDSIFRWYEFKYLGVPTVISGVSKKVIFMAAIRIA